LKLFLSGTSFSGSYGGPAYSVSRLATALAEEGIDIGLWAPDGSAVTSPLVSASRVSRLSGSLAAAMERFGKTDIIHDNGIWRRHNHEIAVVAANRKIPRVVSTRGMLEPWAMKHKRWKKRWAWPAYQKRDLRSASWLHATSDAEASNLARLGLEISVRVIPNGVDAHSREENATYPRRSRRDGGTRTALFLGRIYPVKGLPLLIEAWNAVRPAGWKLQIVGPDEGGHASELRRAVTRAGLDDAISFHPEVHGQEKERFFAGADLFILPSHSESFGMSIGEAFSHTLPVLTTTAAPWPSIEEKGAGWRVPADVTSIAAALKEATSLDSATLHQMGERGLKMVEEGYRWPAIAKRFVAEYATAIRAA
jgi:glycosyltransferase involved in cell wall biosynthesis